VQINRFCASGLEAVNMAAQKVRSGWEDLVVAGGVESMSRVPIGSDGGAWAMDPETNSANRLRAQGIGADLIATLEGFSRAGCGLPMRWNRNSAPPRRRPPATSTARWCRREDSWARPSWRTTNSSNPTPRWKAWPASNPPLSRWAAWALTQVALTRYPQVERIHHVHHAGNSSGIVDGAAAVLIG